MSAWIVVIRSVSVARGRWLVQFSGVAGRNRRGWIAGKWLGE